MNVRASLIAVLVVLALAPRAARAQTSRTTSDAPDSLVGDSLFARAERMVREGRGAAGRALVDSAMHAARPGSPAYVDALYWRARLAASAADAERGYRQLIVEYPLAAHADDALLNLAQLQLARGERAQAIMHLQRLDREHPASPERPRGDVLLARLYFATNDTTRACEALTNADRLLAPSSVELRNQVEYYRGRCAAGAALEVRSAATEAHPTREPPRDSALPRNRRPAEPRPESGGSTTGRSPITHPAPRIAHAAPRYTIQLAAYNTRAEAEHLVERLTARGFAARVVGEKKPFRVRLGVYPSREAAVAAAKRVRAKKMDAMVVAEPERER